MSRGHPAPKAADGDGLRSQCGALCWRRKQGKLEVLLVTSRTRQRWIIPKGWPEAGLSPARSAEKEAWEEGGARGRAGKDCLGLFGYTKLGDGKIPDVPVMVSVFPLRVTSLAKAWPEMKERRRRWFTPKRAAEKVQEVELRALLRRFAP